MELNDLIEEFRRVVFKMIDCELAKVEFIQESGNITLYQSVIAYQQILSAFDKIVEDKVYEDKK